MSLLGQQERVYCRFFMTAGCCYLLICLCGSMFECVVTFLNLGQKLSDALNKQLCMVLQSFLSSILLVPMPLEWQTVLYQWASMRSGKSPTPTPTTLEVSGIFLTNLIQRHCMVFLFCLMIMASSARNIQPHWLPPICF